jgi:hypothetical protein
MNTTSCLFGSRFILNLFFLLAGALSLLKKSTKGLHYFGLDCGMLELFKYSYSIQRIIVDFPAFLEHGSVEKITVCAYTNRDPNKQEVGFIFV